MLPNKPIDFKNKVIYISDWYLPKHLKDIKKDYESMVIIR
jgi:hypothetical protein